MFSLVAYMYLQGNLRVHLATNTSLHPSSTCGYWWLIMNPFWPGLYVKLAFHACTILSPCSCCEGYNSSESGGITHPSCKIKAYNIIGTIGSSGEYELNKWRVLDNPQISKQYFTDILACLSSRFFLLLRRPHRRHHQNQTSQNRHHHLPWLWLLLVVAKVYKMTT